MAVEIIAATTSAVTVKARIRVTEVPSTIIADNLATTEECDLFFSVDNGTTWKTLQEDGAPTVLTATNNAVAIYSPMLIGITKDATAGACGVYQSAKYDL